MRIGLDLDNTLINYRPAFLAQARLTNLIADSFSGSKQKLRDSLIDAGSEEAWQRLQGYVYGLGIEKAELFPGVLDFLAQCKITGHEAFIVSHKTVYGHYDETQTNLREAALSFLKSRGVLGAYIDKENVHFRSTRSAKIAKITSLDLDCFIDDLPEVLLDSGFPEKTARICFSPDIDCVDSVQGYQSCQAWNDISRTIGLI